MLRLHPIGLAPPKSRGLYLILKNKEKSLKFAPKSGKNRIFPPEKPRNSPPKKGQNRSTRAFPGDNRLFCRFANLKTRAKMSFLSLGRPKNTLISRAPGGHGLLRITFRGFGGEILLFWGKFQVLGLLPWVFAFSSFGQDFFLNLGRCVEQESMVGIVEAPVRLVDKV